MKQIGSMLALVAVGAALTLAGCKSAPPLTAADAQAMIQAKYDAQPAAGASIAVDDAGMLKGIQAKLWERTKFFPNKFYADFKLTDAGKKAVTLPKGGDVIEWRPSGLQDKSYTYVVTSTAANHLKAKEVNDPSDDQADAKTVSYNEVVDMTGVQPDLADIAHNAATVLATKRTARFALDGGAWKLASIN